MFHFSVKKAQNRRSNWSAWMDTSPETETTSDSASTSSGFPPEAAADSTVTRSATTSDALVTTSVLVTTSKAPVTSSKAPVTSFTGSSIVPASTSHDLAVAVAIVGGARSLLWNAVCKNIKAGTSERRNVAEKKKRRSGEVW